MLIRRIRDEIPGVNDLFKQHLKEQGELLPHVFFGDVTRFFLALVGRHDEAARAASTELMHALEEAMDGDEPVQELVVASFLENLLGDPMLDSIRQHLPPKLRRAFERVEQGGAATPDTGPD
jgi:hypothetical protein